jgi:hypothetical protein
LALSQSKILGMLLNRVDIHNNEYGGYYQQYYTYYRDDDSPARANGTPTFVENGNGASPHQSADFSENGNGSSPRQSRRHRKSPVLADGAVKNGAGDAPKEGVAEKLSEVALPGVLEVVRSRLLHAMGPMARFVIREHVRALGESLESFPPARLEELTQRVSREIADDNLRLPVEDEVLKDAKIKTENGAHQTDGLVAAAPVISEKTKELRLSAPVEHSEEVSNPAMTKFPDKGLTAEFLDAVADKLLFAMGPMAPIVLREHVRALGDPSGSFSKAKLEELGQQLGKEIANDYHRSRFEKELSEEIQKLGLQANGGHSEKPISKDNGTPKSMAKKELRDTQEFLRIMSAKLSEAIGPIAPLILREQIVALAESVEAFPEAKIEELIVQVSIEISTESTRRQFQKEMAREIQNLQGQGAGSRELGVGSDEAKSKWCGWGRRAWSRE